VVAIGVAIGTLGAIWLGRLLENQVFGVTPADMGTLAATAAFVAAGCLAATWLPSRLAARVDSADVLRSE
jgi:ABC-type lipoprotein release transport system permease subunit